MLKNGRIIDVTKISLDLRSYFVRYIIALIFITVIIIIFVIIITMAEYSSENGIVESDFSLDSFNIEALDTLENNDFSNITNFNIYENSSSKISYPLSNHYPITSKFGKRVHPVTGKESFHYGVDFGAPEGTNLIAVTDGIVTKSSFDGANGYSIHITDSNGYTYIYGHVNPYKRVRKGAMVFKGQTIGYVGPKYISHGPYMSGGRYTNGYTTGVHLHFGVKKNGKYIDPLTIL